MWYVDRKESWNILDLIVVLGYETEKNETTWKLFGELIMGIIENIIKDEKTGIIKEGIYCFGNSQDGDYFDEDDVDVWRNEYLEKNWKNRDFVENLAIKYLLDQIVRNSDYVIDLASGPGMGLIPSIKLIDNTFPCITSDANMLVMKEWKKYLEKAGQINQLEFAQFSLFNIPFKDNSVQAYSSFIGISSTREGNYGYSKALSEIYRTLVDGGMFFTIESQWNDVSQALKLFDKINMQPWICFKEENISWRDRFAENGFEVIYEQQCGYRKVDKNDNDLGEAADKYGVDIGITFTAYIVKKTHR